MQNKKRLYASVLIWAAALGVLYLTRYYNYLFFYALTEMFSVAVAVAIFMLVWNVRRSLDNPYLLFVGVAYLFVGCLDLVHTLAYQGMGLFKQYEANLQTQLWIASRYLESLSLMLGSFFLGRRLKLEFVLVGCLGATALLLGTIFYWDVFPACFVEGVGPTAFKELSDYAIVLILAAAIAMLFNQSDQFDPVGLRFIGASIAFTILSELCFSFFMDVYGIPYFFGHFLKLISFYCIYKAIIELGMSKPFAVLFRNLKDSEDIFRRERDFISAVLSTAGALVVILDLEGRIVRFNRACERLTGYSFEEVKGRPFGDLFLIPEEVGPVQAVFGRLSMGQFPNEYENHWVARDGSRRRIMWSNTALAGSGGSVEHIICTGIDITERKRAEEALREAHDELERRVQERTAELVAANKQLAQQLAERRRAEEELREAEKKYRIVADNTYDWEWWRDPKGNFIYVSPSCKRITYHERDEFQGDPDLLFRIIHPEDQASFIRHQNDVEQAYSSGELEFRILRPDGSLRWLAHTCQPVFDDHGRLLGRRGSNRDITAHRAADDALRESEKQLRYLSSRLLTAQETERRRIAGALHDELGGALAVLKLRTRFIERNLQPGQTAIREECQWNLQYIDQIIDDVHRLSRDLSPSILEDIGLTPALGWLIDNFVRHYGIKAAPRIENVDHLLSRDDQIMIFRTFQEALTNIGKHAQAGNVVIEVRRVEDRISLFVEDDGRGFDMEELSAKKVSEKGLGLAAMNERARMLGGSLSLRSEQGKGTRIALSIPLRKGEKR
ncbi:MAG: PAS domain S-box protein [Desulfobacterales bacterium]|nr:MAG: PAS domain S-box protein [Desulfobacterales bacterium]